MNSGSQRRACEFRLLRYVPDAVRNEYVHIGVILRERAAGNRPRWCGLPATGAGCAASTRRRIRRCWRGWRASCAGASQAEPDGKLMRLLAESLSLSVQMTEPQGVPGGEPSGGDGRADAAVCGAAAAGADAAAERAGGDPGADAHEFERAGVWELLRKRIAASEYTRPGDPLRIDVGYRPNGMIRMFHAVSLEPGVEMAKVLAFSAAGLRAGVERVEKAELELTAVIEPAARLGATRRGAGAAGDVPLWRGDDGGAPDPGVDHVGPGPGGGDGAAGAAGVKEQ